MLCGCGGGGAVLVYTSKGLAWFGAVVVLSNGAKQRLGAVRVLCASKGLVLGAGAKRISKV